MDLGIKYLDYYLPEGRITIDNFIDQISEAAVPKSFDDKNEYRSFAGTILQLNNLTVESTLDACGMLSVLLERMFDRETANPLDIDLIILINEHADNMPKNLGQLLQFKFGMLNSYVINVSGNHCANFEAIISTFSMTGSGNLNNILVLNATLADLMDSRVVGTYGILGDAAGILLLSRSSPTLTIKNSYVINNGRLHSPDLEKDNSILHTKYLIKCIRTVMETSGIGLADISCVIVQNANPLLNAHVLANSGIDIQKIFTHNFGRYGHLDCLDFVVNLSDISKMQVAGDLILALGMGWAGSYSAILFSKN